MKKKGKFEQARSHAREDAEMSQAFRQVTSSTNKKPGKKKKKGKGPLIAVLCILALLLLGVGGVFVYDRVSDDGLILQNVHVLGIDLSGMSKEEASAALHGITDDTYAVQSLTVELPDCKLVLSPEQTGAKLDVEKLVEDAWGYGRDGNIIERAKARADAKLTEHSIDVLPYLNLDLDSLRSLVEQLAQDASSELTQPTAEVTGKRPGEDEEDANGQTLTITMGTAERSLDADSLYEMILDAFSRNDYNTIFASYEETLPEKPDLEKLYKEYCVDPVDAVMDEETFEITPDVPGYGFDLDAVQKQLDKAEEGQKLTIPFKKLEAKVTKESLGGEMFSDVLGKCSTEHTNIPDRTHNLDLACQAIDGYIVKPGEVFSFNGVVGERTAEKGYRNAIIYSAGQSVPSLGGGVCQVASTIYCCALYADLEIVERECHQFYTTYVPHPGMDATVYWGSLDFKFRNNTDYPIRIDANVSGGYVHVTLWGKDTKDYTVDITSETVSTKPWSTEYKEIQKGSAEAANYYDGQVITTPYTGYTINTYKVRTNKVTGETTTEFEAKSVFSTRNQVVVKLVGGDTKPPATEPPATEPPVTDPPATEPPEEPTLDPSAEG